MGNSINYRGQTVNVTGFVFHGGFKNGVWIEGTLQMALAHKKYGDPAKATEYYKEALKTRQVDDSLVLNTTEGWASSDWYHKVWRAIASTAWVVLYTSNFNPCIIY